MHLELVPPLQIQELVQLLSLDLLSQEETQVLLVLLDPRDQPVLQEILELKARKEFKVTRVQLEQLDPREQLL